MDQFSTTGWHNLDGISIPADRELTQPIDESCSAELQRPRRTLRQAIAENELFRIR